MGTGIFVRNLSEEIDSSELTSIFEEVGDVTSTTIRIDVVGGIERRVALVHMATAQQALDGIGRFHGYRTHGSILTVTSDLPHVPVVRPSKPKVKAASKASTKSKAV